MTGDDDDRRFYAIGDDSYQLTVASLGIQLTIDRLRRDRHELIGELTVACDLAGAQTVAGNPQRRRFQPVQRNGARHAGEAAGATQPRRRSGSGSV